MPPTGNTRNFVRGAPGKLHNPDTFDAFVRGATDGLTNGALAEMFGVTDRTIKNWKKDPRVKAASLRTINDRIVRITAKADAKLDALMRSEKFNDLPIEEQITLLLKLRKEYLGGVLRMQAEAGKVDADTINDTMDQLEGNPDFAEELRDLLERTPTKG